MYFAQFEAVIDTFGINQLTAVRRVVGLALNLDASRVLCLRDPTSVDFFIVIVGAKRRSKQELRATSAAMYIMAELDKRVNFVWVSPDVLTQLEVAYRLGGLACASTVGHDLGVGLT